MGAREVTERVGGGGGDLAEVGGGGTVLEGVGARDELGEMVLGARGWCRVKESSARLL